MGYAQESGYIPADINTIMNGFMTNINTQFGTSYTTETFVGTNFYKYFYAIAQKYQENEVKTAEIFQKLQVYFGIINERIARPVVTSPGIIEKLLLEGFIASVKPMIDADAGKISVCVDTDETADDYEDVKLELCTLLSNMIVGGVVSQGTEIENIVLSNGQSFPFKFFLPDRIEVLLRLTVTLSENNQVLVGSPDDVKIKLLQNILSRYSLGRNFEPQRYFSVNDVPWASAVKLEWSVNDGVSWSTAVYDAAFDDLFDVKLENIELVEN